MNKITLTTFTDPMMGLSYECEPVMRKLETHFAGQIEFHYAMGLLVRNVHDFMMPEDYADTDEVRAFVQPFIDSSEVSIRPVKRGWFIVRN